MADNVAQKLDRLYTGLVYVHYGLQQFYQKLDVGNAQQRQQTRLRLYQNIQELGRLINSLKPLISQTQAKGQFERAVKTAAPKNKLSNLTGEIDERLSEITNWTIMMRANEQDRQSMLARVRDLARMFHRLKDFLNVQEVQDKVASLEEIVQFADYLDSIGAYALADTLTESALIIKQAYVPKMREEKTEEPPPVQPLREGALSTRYCPDHRGVQAIRVAERTYQCPIDGKVYNYETGYVNYQGQQVPGGSVAAQTPIARDSGGVPMRIYDSRQSVLNRIN